MDQIHLGAAFGFTADASPTLLGSCDSTVLIDLRDKRLQFSREQLNEAIRATSTALLNCIVSSLKKDPHNIKGTSVAIVFRNTAEYVTCFLGISGLSCVNALLNPKFKVDDFLFAMQDMKCEMLLLEEDGNKDAEAAAAKLGIPIFKFRWQWMDDCSKPRPVIVSQDGSALPQTFGMNNIDDYLKPRGDDICLKLHTSGTTSRPKIVPISHLNCCVTLGNIAQTYKWQAGVDRGLLIMPLFHVHGLFAGCLSPLSRGSRVVLAQGFGFHKSTFWDDVISNKITWVTAVPSMWQILLASRSDISPKDNQVNFRFIRGCSSSLPKPVAEALEEWLETEVLEAYAMTEATHQMCSNPCGGKRKFGSVGLPTGIDCAIICPDTGKLLPLGESGEVCVRGYNVIRGYENLADADQAKHFWYPEQVKVVPNASFISRSLRIDMEKGTYAEKMKSYYDNEIIFPNDHDLSKSPLASYPFLRTGDIGYMDNDYYVNLIGRSKELINRGGEKISPLEVDAEFLKHDEIAEAASFGAPDDVLGEVVHMGVVLAPGVTPSQELMNQLRDKSKQRIAPFKIPVKIFVCDALPKGPTGKILRREMPELLKGRSDAY